MTWEDDMCLIIFHAITNKNVEIGIQLQTKKVRMLEIAKIISHNATVIYHKIELVFTSRQ